MGRDGALSLTAWRQEGMLIGACYAVLGLADMALSSVAFVVGVPEMNPFLAWLAARGLFVPGKVTLTILVGMGLAWLCRRQAGRALGWMAILAMAGVNLYHLWGLGWL